MRLILEIPQETEHVLAAGALFSGRNVADYAAILLTQAADDAADAFEADRIMAETPASGWTSWEDIKSEARL